jgi:predicted ArsR family transcriptional regulator
MAPERDAESGKYTDAYSDEDFIDAIQVEGGLAGTSAVAEIVGCTHRQALNRLKDLEEREMVTSKDVGRSLVWQLPSDR